MQIGPIGCPETSVNNSQHTQWNIPEEREQVHRGEKPAVTQTRMCLRNCGSTRFAPVCGTWELFTFVEALWHHVSHANSLRTVSPCRNHSHMHTSTLRDLNAADTSRVSHASRMLHVLLQTVLSAVSRDSAVGIATRYGLDGPGIESRWGRDFPHPSWSPLGPTHPLYNGYRVFPGVKAAGAWRWPPTPSSVEVKEGVELYIYSPSGPSWHVLGWTLPLPLPLPSHRITLTSGDEYKARNSSLWCTPSSTLFSHTLSMCIFVGKKFRVSYRHKTNISWVCVCHWECRSETITFYTYSE
jgi:hypothetical protein